MTTTHPVTAGYYIKIYCPHCHAGTYQGPCWTTMSYKGLPAIYMPIGSRVAYGCDNCDAVIKVGELHVSAEDNPDD